MLSIAERVIRLQSSVARWYKIRMPVTSEKDLEKLIDLTESERRWKEDGKNTLPLLISDHIASMLGIPAIRKQFVPDAQENTDTDGTMDPLLEEKHENESRLIHRYHNRVAFLVTDRCFSYCRHCFRRRFTGTLTGPATEEEIEKAAVYVENHREVKEILLTGGDMFTLSDERLDHLLSTFKAHAPSVILRLCTRAVAVYPERFTDSLFSIIRKNQTGAPFYLMTQFNHPAELTEDAVRAVNGFLDLGIPAMNQTVLLRGVNDDADTLIELCNRLLYNRIKPYYLFQGDLVRGTQHLRVPVEKGLEIEKKMRTELSGLGMPQYTIDLPDGGGKVILTENHLIGKEGREYIFTTPEGDTRRYPDPLN